LGQNSSEGITTLTKTAAQEIIEYLRRGEVPPYGVKYFLVDREELLKALREDLGFIDTSPIGYKSKYIRGHYGTGKTFALHLILNEALERGFGVSLVVLDNRENRFDWLENVYRSIMTNLQTSSYNSGALAIAEILERWNRIFFKDRWLSVRETKYEIAPVAPYFATVLSVYFKVGSLRSEIISWLMGHPHIPFTTKREFGVRGDIDRNTCMDYLSAFTRVVKDAGYKGLVLLFDEAEAITRLPREKAKLDALENVRILDDNNKFRLKHTYVVFGGTYDFFEGEDGVPSYPALHQRLRTYDQMGRSYRQPIVDLEPLPENGLVELLRKLRDIYEVAYERTLSSSVTENVLQKIDEIVAQSHLDTREVIRRFVALLDKMSVKEPS